jgi:hypothetical protein
VLCDPEAYADWHSIRDVDADWPAVGHGVLDAPLPSALAICPVPYPARRFTLSGMSRELDLGLGRDRGWLWAIARDA